MLLNPKQLAELDPGLGQVLSSAAESLPEGWCVELVPTTAPPGPPGPIMVIEVRLHDARGHIVSTDVRSETGAAYHCYKAFADRMYIAAYQIASELGARLAWGGRFTGQDGRWQVGRFDLGGVRGRGKYRRPPKVPSLRAR